METTVSFTVGQLFAFFGALCGTIVSFGGAAAIVIKVIKKFKEPNSVQDDRIEKLEKRADNTDKMLDNDNKRLLNLESEGRLTLRAVLALLKHGINGNDTKAMSESMTAIEKFLITGKTDD